MAILLCSAETTDARPTLLCLKDISIGSDSAVEVWDHLCGNSVPKLCFQPSWLLWPLLSSDCYVMSCD